MEIKSEDKNLIEKNKNPNIEESEDSTEIQIPFRARSHGKIIYSKITKNLKKQNPLSLNIYSSVSSPSIPNMFGKQKASIQDYNILRNLGSGSYAKVILAERKDNGKIFAIKAIKKDLLDHYLKQYEVHVEKYCIANLSHPNIIKLNKSFQDKKHLYFVLEYCKNQDLGKLIQSLGTFNFKLAQYYAAEILSALSYMNGCGIYHRDLKPENIGVDEDMHLKIFDFATANMVGKYFDSSINKFVDISPQDYEDALKNEQNIINDKETKKDYLEINKHKIMNLTEKFVGTPEYISPEVLDKKYDLIGPSVDIWAFGVMLYLFFVGKTPFQGKNEDETLDNIRKVNYSFELDQKNEITPDIPKEAKDLIQKILIKDPTKRIGYGSKDYKEIKEHPFFNGINFDNLLEEPIPLAKIYSTLEKLGYIDKSDQPDDKDDDIYVNVLTKSVNDNFDDNNSLGSADNADLSINCKRFNSNNLNLLRKNISLFNVQAFHENMIIDNNDKNNKIETPKNKKSKKDEVLIEDELYKKSIMLHYNKRNVKLFSRGHLDYYDCSSKILKGTIMINENTKAYALDDFKFKILSQNKIYFFKHISERVADNWVKNINKLASEKIET